MEREIEVAIHHALSLSRARGGQLAAVTLRGGGHEPTLLELARRVLERLGREIEVRFEMGVGPIELLSIELHPSSRD